MRKFFFLVLAAIIFLPMVILSQDNQNELDDLDFDTEELQQESNSYFSVGAGYTYTYNLINLDDLNSIGGRFGFGELKTPFFASGFEITTGAIIVKNLNVGFFSYSGSTSSTMKSDTSYGSFNYEIANKGFGVDYAFVPYKAFAILPGFQFGFGSSQIILSKTGQEEDWGNLGEKEIYYNHQMTKNFWNLEPRLSLQYAVTNFLMFRAIASYAFSLDNPLVSSNWEYNNNAKINNVPGSINHSGFKFQLGLFIGLMNF
ncbi:MAG: hypothetical protein A2X64_10370 [Ignavibacteria bacterium GWF2_33_9]|nr:MAG: hypothetical protein A2X64_10370 [Ignavibacteria bacterium GWF2_33_9]